MPNRLLLHLLFIISVGGLGSPAAFAQPVVTTSSSFRGEATYSQNERFFFETRVLAEIINDLGTVTIYDQTFTNAYREFTDHQEFAAGDSMAEFASEKAAAEARVPFPQPGNLVHFAPDGTPFGGQLGPPDVTAAIDEAIMLLSASAPGVGIERSDETTTISTRSIEQTSSNSVDTPSVTVLERDDQGQPTLVNFHTHTDLSETFFTTQETFIQTTVHLTADTSTAAVPEPQAIAIWALLGMGLASMVCFRQLRNRLTHQ